MVGVHVRSSQKYYNSDMTSGCMHVAMRLCNAKLRLSFFSFSPDQNQIRPAGLSHSVPHYPEGALEVWIGSQLTDG